MKNFRDIKAWEKAHALAVKVYAATESFPKEERYGVTSQIRRATTSIPTNIAEGCGRDSDADFARFLQIALGSASEVEYLLLLCRDLGLLDTASHAELHEAVVEVKRMLSAFTRRLRTDR